MTHTHNLSHQSILSKKAFWDIELSALDFDHHAKFIITRIFERGTHKDTQTVTSYYGKENIINVLTKANSLIPIAREHAKELFHLTDQDFACYTSKQPTRNLSRY